MPGEDEADDLDGLIRRVDPDRWLTSRFIADPGRRADVIALYAFGHELARARRVASNPLVAEMRLTWWREALGEIFGDGSVRRHPVAQALATAVRRRSLPREPFETMIDGQIEVLNLPLLDATEAVAWADAVEGSLAALVARMLDPDAPEDAARAAGRAVGLARLKRSGLAKAETIDEPLRQALAELHLRSRSLGAAAFPAALPATLARFDLAGRAPGPLARRLALVLASATGRI